MVQVPDEKLRFRWTLLSQAVSLLLLLSLVACQSKEEFASALPDPVDVPDQESWNATLTTTNDGILSSRIRYTKMQKFSGRRIIKFLEGVEIDLYDENGGHTTKVQSNAATLNEVTQTMEFVGNVAVQADNGARLYTEKLIWNEFKAQITSEEFVTMVTTENDTLYGTDFRSEKTLQSWSLKKPRGTTKIESLQR